MQELFTPHIGLMVWTLVTFLVLVVLLARFGWKPLLRALDEREARLAAQQRASEEARQAAERLKADLEQQSRAMRLQNEELLKRAEADGRQIRERLRHEAEEEAQRLAADARRQMEEDRERISRELRQEVAGLSVRMTEKLLRQAMDAAEQKRLVQQVLKDLEGGG